MTPEELKNNPDLLAQCAKEVEEKVRAGQDPVQARLEVFKAHGVQFDADAAKAELVGKMPLSDEELQNVGGGFDSQNWCVQDYACFAVYRKDRGYVGEVCAWDYECAVIHGCFSGASACWSDDGGHE